MKYDFAAIEKKWQQRWRKRSPYAAVTGSDKPKFYALVEFPYPSGQGLHVGHPRPLYRDGHHRPQKAYAGLQRPFPIGFDAFGLPTENYAIKKPYPPRRRD